MTPGPGGRWWEQGGDRPGDDLAPARSRPDRVLSTAPQPVVGSAPARPVPPPRARGPRRRRVALGVVLAAVLVAGAATVAVAAATRERPDAPTVAAATPVATPGGAGGAPAIAAPRDLSGFTAMPCDLLRDGRARALGYNRAVTRPGASGGRECVFSVRDPVRTLAVSALDGPPGSAFADTYRDRATVFTPIEVGGLPAVVTQGHVGSQLCRITVGVAEGQTLRADTYVPSDANDVPITDPCGRALRGVEAAVALLPRAR